MILPNQPNPPFPTPKKEEEADFPAVKFSIDDKPSKYLLSFNA